MTYNDENPATVDSVVFLADLDKVVKRGKAVIKRFEIAGTRGDPETEEVFQKFIEGLYGSGMVMSGFDAPTFDRGPGRLISCRPAAAAIANQANLLTVRMFFHTLARGYRGTYFGEGYPYFADAYHSDGLAALIQRLDALRLDGKRQGLVSLPSDFTTQ